MSDISNIILVYGTFLECLVASILFFFGVNRKLNVFVIYHVILVVCDFHHVVVIRCLNCMLRPVLYFRSFLLCLLCEQNVEMINPLEQGRLAHHRLLKTSNEDVLTIRPEVAYKS